LGFLANLKTVRLKDAVIFAAVKYLISLLIRYIPRKYLLRLSGVGLRVMGFFYAGNQVECPICNHTYRKFLPYGRINPRPNALCPSCLSLERHRLIWIYLREKTDFFTTPMSVLHIAPEQCFMKPFEAAHKDKYITADIESPLAKVKMDIHLMPFADNTFDAVLCNHVLEHVTNDIKAMEEIRRVLKPGGWAILQVPFFSPVPDQTVEDSSIVTPGAREVHFGQDDHVRKYGKDYTLRIERSGLKAEPDHLAAELPNAARYGISSKEIIYKAVKPV
jgi:SAM-dependent methyltransferase